MAKPAKTIYSKPTRRGSEGPTLRKTALEMVYLATLFSYWHLSYFSSSCACTHWYIRNSTYIFVLTFKFLVVVHPRYNKPTPRCANAMDQSVWSVPEATLGWEETRGVVEMAGWFTGLPLKKELFKGQWGVPLTVYPWYLLVFSRESWG